ncbi:UDP-N-acetylmuramyl pentapeptide phosphotransferase/UDP-N-acetylglucosamine-1-phosphate transferase [Hahella chejuensis KCTC 2396]|uniref:UDP-N-acetylmuramyl pentapeptide phosphotransferase/UDP-N-acetylglucosamine-1-phosphate transferase n=2 Tax=Hahella chejuensis TaxID=158327 RepID=Q2SJF9_HAHCH|nr:UDP-N-acetylmuramyl pentapeptide phosphotransferase/UDP-N-acetylglucosamine-1-phosphate transferase [Hahella chejuensis KCTC 2396]
MQLDNSRLLDVCRLCDFSVASSWRRRKIALSQLYTQYGMSLGYFGSAYYLGLGFLYINWMGHEYALANKVLDVPSARSSHSAPTPRGGGVAIATCMLIALPFLEIKYSGILWSTLALLALVGYIDDHRGLGFKVRLLFQVACAYSLICFVSEFGDFRLFARDGFNIPSWASILLGVLGIVWVTNLYNFMDGIDGIAAAEAIFVALSLGGVYAYSGEREWAGFMLAVAVSSLGFLCWNWAPAKIFMGDIGSVSLGWLFGGAMLISERDTQIGIWVYLILMAAFIGDATITLLARLLNREKVWLPHRTHLYQLMSVKLGDHRKVNYLLIFVNVVWLLPMALSAFMMPDWAWGFAVVAYSPLLLTCAVTRGRLIENSKAEEC